MKLKWNGSTIQIKGKAFGGVHTTEAGLAYESDTTDLWNISFEYIVGINQLVEYGVGDDNIHDILVETGNQNFGTILSTQSRNVPFSPKLRCPY